MKGVESRKIKQTPQLISPASALETNISTCHNFIAVLDYVANVFIN